MAKTIKDIMNSMIICDTDGMMYIDLKKCPDLIEFSRIENLIKKRIKELELSKPINIRFNKNLKKTFYAKKSVKERIDERIDELKRLLG